MYKTLEPPLERMHAGVHGIQIRHQIRKDMFDRKACTCLFPGFLAADSDRTPGDQADTDHDHGQDQEDVDIASEGVATHHAERPQNHQDPKDHPKH